MMVIFWIVLVVSVMFGVMFLVMGVLLLRLYEKRKAREKNDLQELIDEVNEVIF